ncbi:hypothetical protein F53441_7720 [Fusarium austroafricanum]|uniref:Uncharacterized protein n=1 Tax=Fusarium austroafricanum TaxID=2364996 RepID=A0A8H4NY45_9HYPO|nr:hypothetical protein F53441_7720 [Fusarium austroafricanum]
MAALGTKKVDQFSFNIQLDTVPEDRGYHARNKPGEIQRPDILDDLCQGLLVQSRVDRIIHGTETKNGSPATLIVFGFRFHGLSKKRRFREAVINILFQDENKNEDVDPVLSTLWPNGDFTLGDPTPISKEHGGGTEVGANAGSDYAGANVKRTWEKRKNYNVIDRARLTGSIILDPRVRNSGPPNTVSLTLSEDVTAESGLVTDLRAAVLLRRRNDANRFTAMVTVDAKAHFSYNIIKATRDVFGCSPANDPILFEPSPENQYIRTATLEPYLEERLAEKVDVHNLNKNKLNNLAGVLGTTALATDKPESAEAPASEI